MKVYIITDGNRIFKVLSHYPTEQELAEYNYNHSLSGSYRSLYVKEYIVEP